MPPALLDEEHDHQLLQNVYEHLASLLGTEWHPIESIETLDGLPAAAKIAWYIWWFEAEVGGSGISGWLVDHAPAASVIIASHEALATIGASEGLELLEAGFAPARVQDAPFLDAPEAAWFDRFPVDPKWPSLEAIDAASYEVCSTPLSSFAATYLRQNRSAL
jgi:hypothetical protein